MRIIVTGGAGFLGRHLCRALDQAGHKIKIIDLKPNPEFETQVADVRDEESMKKLIVDAEAVFHLASLIEAGESVQKPKKYFDYNVMGTLSVLEAMRSNGLKTLLFSSSAAIYGEPESVPITEDDRTLPINPYGATKLAMESLLCSYVEAHAFTGVALRYFNLYGPEEHHLPETHAIPRFIKQIYEGQIVTVWGDGQHLRDFVYIDDIVEAHLKALDLVAAEPNQYHYMNLSTERPHSVLAVIETIADSMDKKASIKHHDPRSGDPLKLYADATKAKQVLKWEAQTSLEQGLQKTVNYFTNYWQESMLK